MHRSVNTRAAYRADVELFAAWCEVHDARVLTADTGTLVAFLAARTAAGDSDATIRRRTSALSSFYDFAVQRRLRVGNPSLGVSRPKVVTGAPSPTADLTESAVADYRAAAAALDPRLEALVALLVSDGLKVAEVLALDIEDVTGRAPGATVTVQRRGTSTRIILDIDSARALRRCVGSRVAGPVFVSERSAQSAQPARLTRFGVDHLIRQLRTDADAEPVTANALRRFHLTARGDRGASHVGRSAHA